MHPDWWLGLLMWVTSLLWKLLQSLLALCQPEGKTHKRGLGHLHQHYSVEVNEVCVLKLDVKLAHILLLKARIHYKTFAQILSLKLLNKVCASLQIFAMYHFLCKCCVCKVCNAWFLKKIN